MCLKNRAFHFFFFFIIVYVFLYLCTITDKTGERCIVQTRLLRSHPIVGKMNFSLFDEVPFLTFLYNTPRILLLSARPISRDVRLTSAKTNLNFCLASTIRNIFYFSFDKQNDTFLMTRNTTRGRGWLFSSRQMYMRLSWLNGRAVTFFLSNCRFGFTHTYYGVPETRSRPQITR